MQLSAEVTAMVIRLWDAVAMTCASLFSSVFGCKQDFLGLERSGNSSPPSFLLNGSIR